MALDPVIRPYQPDDLPRILEITVRAFPHVSIDAKCERDYGLLSGTSWEDRKRAAVEREIALTPDGCFVATLDGAVAGYITTCLDLPANVGRINNLAVDPDVHGQGLGKRLIRQAFEHFRSRQVPYYRIETTVDNEVGKVLYPRAGFREVSRQIIYFMSADEAAGWTYPDDEAPA